MWSWPYMTLVLSTPTFLKKKELTLSAAITKITVTREYLSRFKQMERRSLKNSVLQRDSNPLPMGVFIAQLVEHRTGIPLSDPVEVNETLVKEEKAKGTRGPWFGSSHRGHSSDVPYKRRDMISSALVSGVGGGGGGLPYLSYAGTSPI